MRFLQLWIEQQWYESGDGRGVGVEKNKRRQVLLVFLSPLSYLYKKLAEKRRRDYLSGKKSSIAIDCPVIVVGNITVGGTGKTPLVIWLVEQLQKHGYKPGIVSRGYGGTAQSFPMQVNQACDPALVGDEPAMMARRVNGAPVVIDPNRVRGASYLSETLGCNIIVSDDGLQHYNLKRDIEIAVVDGKRGLGNGRCLPRGPLREPAQRLETVDFVVINSAVNRAMNGAMNGAVNTDAAEVGVVPGLSQQTVAQSIQMSILPGKMFSLQDKPSVVANVAKDLKQPIHALAGIGNPSRFFDTLESMGLAFHAHAFPDHYRYQASDIDFADELDIVMTEKDAIKCQSFASSRCFYLAVNAQMGAEFWPRLQAKISEILNQ